MQEAETLKLFIEKLNKTEIRYMVTGSVACILYGQPRLTHDVDIVVKLHIEKIDGFLRQFPFDDFYCPPKEVIALELSRESRGHFNLIHHKTGFKADIYTIGNDKLHKWAISNRRKTNYLGSEIWLAPPEYVILRKLEYYAEGGSSKHITDIRNILSYCKAQIDTDFLTTNIKQYNLIKYWQEVEAD